MTEQVKEFSSVFSCVLQMQNIYVEPFIDKVLSNV